MFPVKVIENNLHLFLYLIEIAYFNFWFILIIIKTLILNFRINLE